MDYREKLKVKLEEKFFKPNKKIIDRFNEEYEYYQGKNMIKSMYLLSIIKEELEKKDINLINTCIDIILAIYPNFNVPWLTI